VKIKVWVLSTCVPTEARPCFPEVFATEFEALIAFDERMREEWRIQAPISDEGDLLDYPDSPEEAVEIIAKDAGPEWGRWELTSHEIDVTFSRVAAKEEARTALIGAFTLAARTGLLDDLNEAAGKDAVDRVYEALASEDEEV